MDAAAVAFEYVREYRREVEAKVEVEEMEVEKRVVGDMMTLGGGMSMVWYEG